MTMAEELPDDTTPTEETPDPDTLAAELGLGIELSDEEREQAEQMVARLRSQFGVDGSDEGPEPVPEDEPAEEEPEPESPEPSETPAEPVEAPPAESEWISIDGRSVPVAEARSMLELRQYLAKNPEKAAEVQRVIEGQVAPEPAKEAEPPEWLDMEDPAQRFMWTQFQAQDKALRTIASQQQHSAEEQARGRALDAVNHAMNTFRTSHPELTEDEVQAVRTHAVALDIIEGLSRNRSGTDAVLKALDIAYMDHPDFRARQQNTPTPSETKAAKTAERQSKLSALSGSSGSAPRSAPEAKPNTDREMKAAAAKWLQEQNIL